MVLAMYQYAHGKGSPTLEARCKDLTVSVVLEVEKLIIPLRHDPYCIFHECANNEETSSRWYVSEPSELSNQQKASSSTPGMFTRRRFGKKLTL